MADPDSISLNDDGTITVLVDGKRRTLRQPKTGEFKRFRMLTRQRDDEVSSLQRQGRDESRRAEPTEEEARFAERLLPELRLLLKEVEAAGVEVPEPVTLGLVAAADGRRLQPTEEEARHLADVAQEYARKMVERTEEIDQQFMLAVFNGTDGRPGLADEPLPEDPDEWPIWLAQADNVQAFMAHWRQNPLAPGRP